MSLRKSFTIFLYFLTGLTILYLAYFFIYRFLVPPTLSEGNFDTAIVDRGTVVTYLDATGVIDPENTVVMLSPTSSIIKSILHEPGTRVRAGQLILSLDRTSTEHEIELLEDELEVKRNNIKKNRLNARGIRLDLDYNEEVKKLKIASLKSDIADEEQLLEVGGVSPAKLEKTRQELVLAEKDMETNQERNSIRLQQLEADEEGLRLQIQMQEKELEDKKILLGQLDVRAPSAGIIMSLHGSEGEKVNRDQLLVKMSDLTTFKVNGSIPQQQAEFVKIGGEVVTIIDRVKLSGKIGTIRPQIENGEIKFEVFLDKSDYHSLISNQQVELKLIRRKRDDVLRVKLGPAFGRGETQEVFVVRGNMAVKQEIQAGLRGMEYMEIKSGAVAGDRLIISDISSIRHLKEVEIISTE